MKWRLGETKERKLPLKFDVLMNQIPTECRSIIKIGKFNEFEISMTIIS